MNNTKFVSPLSYLAAFVIGLILLLSLGKDWLPLENLLIFLAGLIGLSLAVLLARVWEHYHYSSRGKK